MGTKALRELRYPLNRQTRPHQNARPRESGGAPPGHGWCARGRLIDHPPVAKASPSTTGLLPFEASPFAPTPKGPFAFSGTCIQILLLRRRYADASGLNNSPPMSAIRNMLSHRFSPGRIIHPMVDIHSWNLDLWYESDWSSAAPGVRKSPPKKEFQIQTKSLI